MRAVSERKAGIKTANLFYIELIIALMFFALASAAILNVFFAADKRQKLSTMTERSVICAQSLAEAYSVSGDIQFALENTFGSGVEADGGRIMLNDTFFPDSSGSVLLVLSERSEATQAGVVKHLDMSFTSGQSLLYSLSCCAYLPDM